MRRAWRECMNRRSGESMSYESIVVETVAEHFGIDAGAPGPGVLEFFDDERGRAFAHDESITRQVERTASPSGIARPAAHRFNDVECPDCNSRQRRFRSAGDNYVRKIIPDIPERLAY